MKLKILFLKIAVCFLAIPALMLCILGLPYLFSNPVSPEYANIIYPFLACVYLAVIPYFVALYQALRILSDIDKNETFSELTAKALKKLKYCAIAIGSLCVIALPFVFLMAQADDAPGLVLIGMFITSVPIIIAVFTDILQKLLKNSLDVKSN
jgi:peptidoglycan/LPS O-acetylase OafA/YrhL